MLSEKLKQLRNSFSIRDQTTASPGLYHFQIVHGSNKSRVHLRIDADGSGILIINANRIIHLNETAAWMAFLNLSGMTFNDAIELLVKRYKLKRQMAISDYAQLSGTLDELFNPNGACPVHALELDIAAPFSLTPSAPYRMDLAITYRCNNDCSHCYNARARSHPEIGTDAWKEIIDKLWDRGIPHIVFTGGEPTLRPDLPELIRHAESKGQITGVNTNGRRLSDPDYIAQLVDAGLDHVQVTLESHDPQIHDTMVNKQGAWRQTVEGIKHALELPIFVMTNTTMLQNNGPYLAETLDFLFQLGVPTIGLNALIRAGRGANVSSGLDEAALLPLLEIAREKTQTNNQKLIWYTPTQYCQFDPMQLELGVKGCSAALYNMCIESDGSVIPCQSYYSTLGNILSDDWDSIWNHELSVSLRERRNLPNKCGACVFLAECGGGCPLLNNPSNIQESFNYKEGDQDDKHL